jgi:hypothetical protein
LEPKEQLAFAVGSYQRRGGAATLTLTVSLPPSISKSFNSYSHPVAAVRTGPQTNRNVALMEAS